MIGTKNNTPGGGGPITTLTGTAGTAVCSEPFTGNNYKKVIVRLIGYSATSQSYTFPVAFTATPFIYGLAAGLSIASVSTTQITFTAAVTLTGFLIIEGY